MLKIERAKFVPYCKLLRCMLCQGISLAMEIRWAIVSSANTKFKFFEINYEQIIFELFRVWSPSLRLNVFFWLCFALSVQLVFGQTTVLTKAQFSRLSVVERRGFTISRIALEEQVDPYLLWRKLTTKPDFARGLSRLSERRTDAVIPRDGGAI